MTTPAFTTEELDAMSLEELDDMAVSVANTLPYFDRGRVVARQIDGGHLVHTHMATVMMSSVLAAVEAGDQDSIDWLSGFLSVSPSDDVRG